METTIPLSHQVAGLELEVKQLREENKALNKATCVEALDIVNELAKLHAMLDWLLDNKFPGPVCDYYDKDGRVYSLGCRDDVDYWMKQA
jgi:hypothetical protein